ncbi:MAG: type II secretion system protein [Planctomycetota bacterium]|nr:type II secretion system protein [Planctomycetota bacterium]
MTPTPPQQVQLHQGFTLVEMLVVITVLVALGSMSLWIGPKMIDKGRHDGSQATVLAVATAIGNDGRSHLDLYQASLGGSVLLPAWDLNNDGWLDGDPSINAAHPDPSTSTSEFDAATLAMAATLSYRGPIHDLATLTLPDRRLDAGARILDGWQRPLRIMHRGAAAAPAGAGTGRHFIGIYSLGADGIDQAGAGDDVTSW